jgi:hypothetical protein
MTEHQTKITRIQNGWEFFCPQCGYYARYTEEHGTKCLTILFTGDPQILHTSNPADNPFERWASESDSLARFAREC